MNKVISKRKTIIVLLAAITVVLVTLLFINSKTAQKSSFVMDGRRKLEVTGEVSAVSNSSSLVYCTKDLLIEAQDSNLRAKNIKGNVAWSQKLPAKVSDIAAAGEYIVVTDTVNRIYYYSLQGKLLWTYEAKYEILDLFTEDNGSFLVEYKGMTGNYGEVFIQNGSKVGSILVENSHILTFCVGDNVFSISVLDTSADVIKTKVITYTLKGDILWAQNFDNKIITKLDYDKNTLIALSEDNLYTYAGDGKLQKEVRIEGEIHKAAMGSSLVTLVLQNKGKPQVACYDGNLRMLHRMDIDRLPIGIYPMKNSFILYYDNELQVISSKGELISRFKSNSEINRVYADGDNSLYLVSNRKLQRLEYLK